MCGRYTYLFHWKQLQRLMRLLDIPADELVPRYNVAPTQLAPIVRLNAQNQRVGLLMRWGLVPSWSSDPAADPKPSNARGESIFSKPTFRRAAREQRCLVPVSGFYEWQNIEGNSRKQPYWIRREDREPFCFGGLWERWRDRDRPDAPVLDTFTIVTTSPNALMVPIHHRMPVVIPNESWQTWLDPQAAQSDVEALIRPYPGDDLRVIAVSTAVNSPRREDASLIEPVQPLEKLPGLFG